MPLIKITKSVRTYGTIEVFADGNKVGDISDGQPLEIQLPPGKHPFKVRMKWLGSGSSILTISESTTEVNIRDSYLSVVVNFILVWTSLGLVASYKEYFLQDFRYLYLVIPVVLYNIYNLTYGRRHNLVIKLDRTPGQL